MRLEVKLGQRFDTMQVWRKPRRGRARFDTMRTAADRVDSGQGSGDPGTFDTLRLADDATDSAEEGEGEAASP